MICSVRLKLKLIKMDRQKLITSKEYWIEQLENRTYNGISIYQFAETIANTMKEAINYSQCCKSDSEQLPNMTLEQAIAKAKPNLDKITDVDKHIEDIR